MKEKINCIFCGINKESSEEHVLPSSIGGALIVNYICVDCNSTLGSAADSELNKNRKIYDAYAKLKEEIGDPLKFIFQESYFDRADGVRVKASKTNQNRKIVPTKINENGYFILDYDSDEWVIHNIRLRGQKYFLREYAVEEIIHRYKFWKLQAAPGDRFHDKLTGFTVVLDQGDLTAVTTMATGTPHRFIAKACVEAAYIFGFEIEIKEIEGLKLHALWDGKFDDFKFREETHTASPVPGHIIAFHNHQISVQFFAHFAVGVDITWKNEPRSGYLVNHLVDEKVYLGEVDGENLSFFNRPFYPKKMGLQKCI